MTKKPTPVSAVTFLDNPHAPEFFADEVSGVMFHNGNIRLTFESARVNHISSPGPVNRVVIGRLVMPLGGAQRLRDLLVDYFGKLQDQNAPPQSAPTTLQ